MPVRLTSISTSEDETGRKRLNIVTKPATGASAQPNSPVNSAAVQQPRQSLNFEQRKSGVVAVPVGAFADPTFPAPKFSVKIDDARRRVLRGAAGEITALRESRRRENHHGARRGALGSDLEAFIST